MIRNSIVRLAAALLAASGANALAADTAKVVQPAFQPLSSKSGLATKAAPNPKPSPVLTEMVGTLGEDGHVHVQCHEVPNPEHAEFERARQQRDR